jgi:hypothetical protein
VGDHEGSERSSDRAEAGPIPGGGFGQGRGERAEDRGAGSGQPRRRAHAARSSAPRFGRRRLLVGLASSALLAGTGLGVDRLVSGEGQRPERGALRARPARPKPEPVPHYGEPAVPTRLASGVVVPVAPWVLHENRRPGTLDWVVAAVQPQHAIEGFADRTSVQRGEEVTLFVSTQAPALHVEAYRMGYYQGLGGRLVWRSDEVAGRSQPPPVLTPGINMVECRWAPTLSFTVGEDWPPGDYLLKLVASTGLAQYVPLCVRDDRSTAAFVIQNSVTTYQAYNSWGGYSLYFGEAPGGGQSVESRSRVVSFDRPYPASWANGAADFLGNEFPLVFLAERLGLDVTYWTDIDLHERGSLLLRRRCLLSLGHDEYWSAEMRAAAVEARNRGVNLAFLGANACYRHIRLEPSPLGPDRHQVCYKDRFETEDPMWGVDPARVTANWPGGPDPRPESELTGATYEDVGADADMVIADPSSFLLAGTGLEEGDRLPRAVQGEYDRFDPASPAPRNVQVVCHSPVLNRGPGRYSDVTYYTWPGGGGVVDTGDAVFVNKLAASTGIPADVLPAAIPGVTGYLHRMMENLFSVFGAGPASVSTPSVANWQQFYG